MSYLSVTGYHSQLRFLAELDSSKRWNWPHNFRTEVTNLSRWRECYSLLHLKLKIYTSHCQDLVFYDSCLKKIIKK